jgi:hypothetical protein
LEDESAGQMAIKICMNGNGGVLGNHHNAFEEIIFIKITT